MLVEGDVAEKETRALPELYVDARTAFADFVAEQLEGGHFSQARYYSAVV